MPHNRPKTKDVDNIPQIRDVVDLRKVTDGPHNTIPFNYYPVKRVKP
jgi:hypothetical protein